MRAHAIDEFYTKIVMFRVQYLFIRVNTLIISKNAAYKIAYKKWILHRNIFFAYIFCLMGEGRANIKKEFVLCVRTL